MPRSEIIRAAAIGLLLAGAAAPAATQAQACEPDGDVQFLCGPISPEDFAPVPESPWVIVPSTVDEGHIYAADTRDLSTTLIFPVEAAGARHDTAIYGACPGPVTRQIRPHGLLGGHPNPAISGQLKTGHFG